MACLKCKTPNNKDNGFVELKLKWDTEKSCGVAFYFCNFCQDLTNKLDKLELIHQYILTFPQYAPFRNSIPPPPSLVDCNQQIPDSFKTKTGPAPPDTSSNELPLSNDNTTLEQWRAKAFRYIEERDVAIQDLVKARKSSEEWEKSAKNFQDKGVEWLKEAKNWESKWFQLNEEYKAMQSYKQSWEAEVLRVNEWRNKYQTLKAEYDGVYQREYKELEKENMELGKEVKGYENCTVGGNKCFWKTENDRLNMKLDVQVTELNNARKEFKTLEAENERLWTAKRSTQATILPEEIPPGWYPCPHDWRWNPENKRWEKPKQEGPKWWWIYTDRRKDNIDYLEQDK